MASMRAKNSKLFIASAAFSSGLCSPKMSLKAQGLLGKLTAPILVVGGSKDTQVPIDDLELLMNSGSQPREAWINPSGGHMGRNATDWPDPVIFRKVILPWEMRHLAATH